MITEEEKIDYQKRDIKYLEEIFFIHCRYENFQGIEYLLMSPDLEENIDIHTRNELVLMQACNTGNLEVVKYLLTFPDLKEHADIHAKNDWCFINTCRYNQMKIKI